MVFKRTAIIRGNVPGSRFYYLTLLTLLLLLIAPITRAEALIYLNDVLMKDLQTAFNQATDGSVIHIGAGELKQAARLTANNVSIVGVKGQTKIHSTSTRGKGALVIKGNNAQIKNIECFNIQVPSQNGACIRLHGKNLSVENVYFHDAEQGILTGSNPGLVSINRSRFERLGKNGRAHGIYIGGGKLLINQSYFLSSKSEGHEIKSRAAQTVILNSVIASLEGNDSRLIDIPNGGVFELKDSILQQGKMSSNWDLIGYGQEGFSYPQNQITLLGNLIIMDRVNGNIPLHIKADKVIPALSQNIFVGEQRTAEVTGNIYFPSRQAAKLPEYPALPQLIPKN